MLLLKLRLLLFALPCMLLSGLTTAEPRTLIFSHVVSENTHKGKMALMFKSMIERRLGDQFQVEIYPNTELMDDDEAVALAKNQNDRTELAAMGGVTVHEPTPQQLALWQDAMKPLWQEYEPLTGAAVIEAALEANQLP